MVLKHTISRDDTIYEAWPDVTLTPDGRLICVFSECTHHGDRFNYIVDDAPKGQIRGYSLEMTDLVLGDDD